MSAPARRPGLHTVAVPGGCVVLDPVTSVLHAMNTTAAAVWNLLDGTGVEGLALDLAEAAGADPAVVRRDVTAVVEGLASAGLLDVADAAPGSPASGPPTPGPRAAPRASRGPRIVRAGALTPWQARMASTRPERPRPHGLDRYDALGFGFTVETDETDLAAFVRTSLRALRTDEPTAASQRYVIDAPGAPSRAARTRWAVYLDGVRVLSPATPSELSYQLLGHIAVMAATAAGDRVLLHAAAVGSAHGAVVLPATSGAGKSTLVAALAASGYRYLTDELVALGDAGGTPEVQALRRPIVVKPGSWDLLRDLRPDLAPAARRFATDTWLVTPPGVSGAPPPPGPLAALVLPTFDPDGPDEVHRLDPLDAVAGVWAHLWPSAVAPADALDLVARVCCAVPVYRLARSGLDAVADLMASVAPPPI